MSTVFFFLRQEDNDRSIFLDMSVQNKEEFERDHSSSYEDDDDDDGVDEQEEEINVLEQVQGLFSTEIYSNVIDMFRAYENEFNLVKFLHKHQIVSQYDYIRLINYIRREVRSLSKGDSLWKKLDILQKPSINDLNQLEFSSSPPWANDQYFETVIDNDPALQFGEKAREKCRSRGG